MSSPPPPPPSLRQRRPSAPHDRSPTQSPLSTLEDKASHALLVVWDDLPSWHRDNHYIVSGYRRAPSNSFRSSLHSLTYLSNETVNIHSHLVGAVLFLLLGPLLYNTLAPRYASASWGDVAAFGAFFAGAVACLGMSATFHATSNHSERVARWGNQLDYVGIVALIVGSFAASVYYGFWCQPGLRRLYWGMIFTLGLSCTTVSITPRFRTPAWRPYRATMFVAMGLSAVIPVLHALRLFSVAQLNRQIGLSWVVLQGALYVLGAAIYAARVPERLSPGKYDVWGSSHQIFHVLVVVAALAQLRGLVIAFDYNHGPAGPKC